MKSDLKIYNSLTRQKEVFVAENPPHVGMYVCGPTVYSDAHLGNCRTFMFFDVVYRYLTHLGYKVRYVRNITDVGHLEDEVAGEGEDKISKKARLEQLEPMEIVQNYTNGFHHVMRQINNLEPSIEPTATGHIVEQIELVQKIIDAGYGYESEGSVYFDVMKYAEKYPYGELSGKVLDDLQNNSRELSGQQEKRNPVDFSIWKKANPEHIMRWNSPWGVGFPGWHLECTVMSTKYLGETFDIHGGGMDLQFPHHECEIAQSVAGIGCAPVKYWIHTNMLTVEGKKMSKSLGNSFLPHELFSGNHPSLEQGYSPMTVRFFFLQAHYRSTVDFSNEALKAAEKGYKRLMNAQNLLSKLEYTDGGTIDADLDNQIKEACDNCYTHINDDFNTAMALADLFELANKINAFSNKQLPLSAINEETFNYLKTTFNAFVTDILGLQDETSTTDDGLMDGLMDLLLNIRKEARENKDWATSDKIRDELKEIGVLVKDSKEGSSWVVL
ncbi:MAG: cysteine--tRNA ligase [Chitinophagales bacterium]